MFTVDILHPITGDKLGMGPLSSATGWRYTARYNRAGSIAFEYDASDPVAQHITNRNYARATALLGGQLVEVGHGRIDNTRLSAQGLRAGKNASGLDLIGELRDKRVGDLILSAEFGAAVPIADALAAIAALAPPGWTIAVDPDDAAAMATVQTYGRFAGESVLGALVMVAEHTQSYFYRAEGRTLYLRRTWDDSGVRAIQAAGALGPQQCAISSLSRTIDTHDLLTRIYPFGSGNGRIRLTLAATSRSAPAGYTLNAAQNYIERDEAIDAYGVVDFPEVEFKEIGPVSNTNADLQTAANVLFDSALEELRRRSAAADQETYTLTVAGCAQLLRPLQTLRVIYRDLEQGIDIDRDLYILEATWTADSSGVRTTGLVVSSDSRWPDSDASAAAERATQGRVYMAHPQIGPNSYWENTTLVVGSDQEDHLAKFPFVLGSEVVQVQQTVLWLKPEPVVTFTSTVAATSTSSGASSATTSAGGSTHSHTVTIASHTHGVPNHQHATTVAGGAAGTALGYTSGGGFAFLTKSAAGDLLLNTNVASGATTSDGGGATTPTSSNESSHTHNIDHTHDVTPDIVTSNGVYRATDLMTYDAADLEFRVNGKGLNIDGDWGTVDDIDFFWVSLDDGVAVADDYMEFDITYAVSDTATFRPTETDGYNLVEVRRKTGISEFAIAGIGGGYVGNTQAAVDTSPTNHGLTEGEQVIITGTVNYDGTYTVLQVTSLAGFRIASTETAAEFGVGTVTVNKSAMILAKLGVRDTIQSILYA